MRDGGSCDGVQIQGWLVGFAAIFGRRAATPPLRQNFTLMSHMETEKGGGAMRLTFIQCPFPNQTGSCKSLWEDVRPHISRTVGTQMMLGVVWGQLCPVLQPEDNSVTVWGSSPNLSSSKSKSCYKINATQSNNGHRIKCSCIAMQCNTKGGMSGCKDFPATKRNTGRNGTFSWYLCVFSSKVRLRQLLSRPKNKIKKKSKYRAWLELSWVELSEEKYYRNVNQ